jgi:hypothetical protein
MRALIIGDSHVASIVRALTPSSFPSDIAMEYLSVGRHSLVGNLSIEGNDLILDKSILTRGFCKPASMSPSGVIDLSIFDRVIFYGIQLITRLDWITVVRESQESYSRAVWRSLAADCVRGTDHYRLVSSIEDESIRRRVLSLPSPFPNVTAPQFRTIRNPSRERIKEHLRIMEEEISQVGVRFVPLLEKLLDARGYATAARYKNEREDDFQHLNADGARLVIAHIRSILTGQPSAAASTSRSHDANAIARRYDSIGLLRRLPFLNRRSVRSSFE